MNVFVVVFCSVMKDRRNKEHVIALVKEQCRLYTETVTSSQRIVNEWNTLFAECVGAVMVDMFKIEIDRFPRRAGYM